MLWEVELSPVQWDIRIFQTSYLIGTLVEAFLAADIPLHKLRFPPLRSFLEGWSGMPIPSHSTLKRYKVQAISYATY